MDNSERLKRLKKRLQEFDASFESQEARVAWVAQTAPLLNFNDRYHQSFAHSAQCMDIRSLPSYTIVRHTNSMKSVVLQAISELEHGLMPNEKPKFGEVNYPEKLTLRWLFVHVPVSFWLWVGGIVIAVLVAGIKIGSSPIYQDTIKPLISALKN